MLNSACISFFYRLITPKLDNPSAYLVAVWRREDIINPQRKGAGKKVEIVLGGKVLLTKSKKSKGGGHHDQS
jgi:hypothetical protein